MIDISQRFIHYFPEARVSEYSPVSPRKLYAQAYGGSCVAACVRMLLRDHDYDQPEAYIRGECVVDADEGGYVAKVPDGLAKLEFPVRTLFIQDATLEVLRGYLSKSCAIVSVRLEGYGTHALVVDAADADRVCVRDPLPVGMGSAYAVHPADFEQVWKGKAVVVL